MREKLKGLVEKWRGENGNGHERKARNWHESECCAYDLLDDLEALLNAPSEAPAVTPFLETPMSVYSDKTVSDWSRASAAKPAVPVLSEEQVRKWMKQHPCQHPIREVSFQQVMCARCILALLAQPAAPKVSSSKV